MTPWFKLGLIASLLFHGCLAAIIELCGNGHVPVARGDSISIVTFVSLPDDPAPKAEVRYRIKPAAPEVFIARKPAAPKPRPVADPKPVSEPPPPASTVAKIRNQEVSPAMAAPPLAVAVLDQQAPPSSPDQTKAGPIVATQSLAAAEFTRPAEVESNVGSSSPSYFSTVAPTYPREARKRKQEGLVIVLVEVDEQGRPVDARISHTSGFDTLDAAAIRSVRQWRFAPGIVRGHAVKATAEVPIRFCLRK